MNISRLFHTVRYLRPSQVVLRIVRRFQHPSGDVSPAPEVRSLGGGWVRPAEKYVSLVSSDRARFLNEERNISGSTIWNDPGMEKLWLYNLHYFDDLNAENAPERRAWHDGLINRWIAENPPVSGNGWEPYPTSLRIVNWFKWCIATAMPFSQIPDFQNSLAVQTRYLSQTLEYHLLGNHLLENAKALIFAGTFFQGPEADGWIKTGLDILTREIPEQILPDGGQFERSPMYHAIALEDMCDLINVFRAYPESIPPNRKTFVDTWPAIAERMLGWMKVMCHPDGEIALFNDAAHKIAPSPKEIGMYCGRLGIVDHNTVAGDEKMHFSHLESSGYIQVEQEHAVTFLDLAPIGPDYLPGHAHADTLTFECSLFNQRVVVNSGTSCYGLGDERLRQRSTPAHNTVVVDNENSSEVWSGFRVARRAYPQNLSIVQDDNSISVSCEHNGYTRLPGKPIHARQWHFGSGSIQIFDKIKGAHTTAEARFHLHPDVLCNQIDTRTIELILPKGQRCTLTFSAHPIELEKSSYHPEFGISLPCICISVAFIDELTTSLAWT